MLETKLIQMRLSSSREIIGILQMYLMQLKQKTQLCLRMNKQTGHLEWELKSQPYNTQA